MSTILKSFYHNLKEPIIICDFSVPENNGKESPKGQADVQNEGKKGSANKLENLNGVYFNKAFQNVFPI